MNTSAVTAPSRKPSGTYELVRLGYVARLQNGLTVDAKRDVTGDVVTRPYLRVANVQAGSLDLESVTEITVPRSVAQRSTLRPGDVLMTEGGDLDKLGRGTVWQGELDRCLHQNHIFAVRPDAQRLSGRFLAYVTQSLYGRHYFESTGTRTTNLASTNSSKIQSFPVPLPPLDEQRRIVDFLDVETARTDTLTVAMSSQDVALRQRRLHFLDFASECAPGTPVARLGYLSSLVTSGSRGWGDFVSDTGSLFFRSANLHSDSVQPRLANLAYVQVPAVASSEAQRSRIETGDVLIGITGANAGWICVANDEVAGGHVSQHVCLVRPDKRRINSEWLAFLIASPAVQNKLMASQYGGAKAQLSLPDIRDIRIPTLSLEQQDQVAISIRRNISAIDKQRLLRQRQLVLLAERRQALITAAVTGQFDVSTASGRNVTDGVTA